MKLSFLSCAGTVLLIGLSLFLSGCAHAQQPPTSTQALVLSHPIINHISLPELVRAAEGRSVPLSSTGFNGAFGLMNQWDNKGEGCKSLSVAIYPSASLAQQKFKADISRSPVINSLPKTKVGDNFLPFILTEKERHAIGETGDVHSGGMVYMRENNVLISFSWRGSAEGAVDYARKVEQALKKADIATTGRSITLPTIDISPPGSVEADTTTAIPYQAQNGVIVSPIRQDFPKWGISGEISFYSNKVGKQKVHVDFLTQDNRVIPVSFTVNVVPKATTQHNSWTWPGSRLFFKSNQEKTDASAERDNLEWIELNPSTFEIVEDKARINEVEKLLKVLLQSRWQAPRNSIRVFNDHSTSPATKVYFCTFKAGDFNIACWGTLTGKSWLYIDYPVEKTTMPQLSSIINWKEIKKRNAEKNLLAIPNAEVTTRYFKRFRSLNVAGPWKPVNILLVRILLPEQIDFQFVGQ